MTPEHMRKHMLEAVHKHFFLVIICHNNFLLILSLSRYLQIRKHVNPIGKYRNVCGCDLPSSPKTRLLDMIEKQKLNHLKSY